MNSKIIFLILLLLSSTYAIDNYVSLTQWKNLNATTKYTNEFMKCYIYNSTSLNWASYISGQANITSGHELEGIYTIACCDNCYFNNEDIVLSSYSLNYDLGNINITSPMDLHYYIGDILDSLHGIDIGDVSTNSFSLDNYIYFTPVLFIIGLGMFLFVLLKHIIGFVIGAIIGGILGIFFLISVGAIAPFIAILIFILVILGGIIWAKSS